MVNFPKKAGYQGREGKEGDREREREREREGEIVKEIDLVLGKKRRFYSYDSRISK